MKTRLSPRRIAILPLAAILVLASCSPSRKLQKLARESVISSPHLKAAHVGICVFDPSINQVIYGHNSEKYFVPASNTKIPTCYAAMKYLGDSLAGIRYLTDGDKTVIEGTADPTLLHTDFRNQPVFDMLKKWGRQGPIIISGSNWKERALGSGWSWNDYNESYMAERSPLPFYGNIVRFQKTAGIPAAFPGYFNRLITTDSSRQATGIQRSLDKNQFLLGATGMKEAVVEIPYHTAGYSTAAALLADTLGIATPATELMKRPYYQTIYSQPLDSVLRPMMFRSDNFFAEQILLMVSNERLGFMNDAAIIDTILKTDFADLPQKPRWVDGSGLSRYNLFTPHDFVVILKKMNDEFGTERLKHVFATGGQGTISNYYKNESGFIYGKTGTLSGVVALSGFLYTTKGRLLLFSTIINNHQSSATEIRRAVEKFLQQVMKNM